MNDRYLYRAKRTDNGELVEGSLITGVFSRLGQDITYILCPDKADYYCFEDFSEENGIFEVDPSTICQCTGKHDIPENKMIYEHDFVSFLDTYSTENGYAEQYCVGEVLWDDEELCFYVTDRLSAESYEVLDDCKVIGNRFDNPELLEVGE